MVAGTNEDQRTPPKPDEAITWEYNTKLSSCANKTEKKGCTVQRNQQKYNSRKLMEKGF
jgi:hypothetical protein